MLESTAFRDAPPQSVPDLVRRHIEAAEYTLADWVESFTDQQEAYARAEELTGTVNEWQNESGRRRDVFFAAAVISCIDYFAKELPDWAEYTD